MDAASLSSAPVANTTGGQPDRPGRM